MKNKKTQKTVDDYRKDIFTLKAKIQNKQQLLQDLRQKYSNLNILSDQSYTYSMKIKILEYSLAQIKQNLLKYTKNQAFQYYALNFSMLALLRGCQVVGITPQMVFRGMDEKSKGEVSFFDFSSFLKNALKMDSTLSNPILHALDPNSQGIIQQKRYLFLLQSFLARKEQNGQLNSLNQSMQKVATLMIQRNIDIRQIWKQSSLNIATFIHGIVKQLPKVDILDCVGCYCRCDPLKQGNLQKIKAIANFDQKIIDLKNFKRSSLKKI